MRKIFEQELNSIITEGFSFDESSLGNASSEASHCSFLSDTSCEKPPIKCSVELGNEQVPKMQKSMNTMSFDSDINIFHMLCQVMESIQRLETKVDEIQNVLTDLTERPLIKTPHFDSKMISQNIKKKVVKDESPIHKDKSLTWRSGLGLPVTSVVDVNLVNQKLNTADYLAEFRTLLRHSSSRGVGLNEKLKLILKEALGSEIGGLYNLTGTCGKRSIEKTELFNVIQNYIMEIYGATNETRRAVKLVFHRFLKNQQDRITKAAKCKTTELNTPFESFKEKLTPESGKRNKMDANKSDRNIRSVPNRSNDDSSQKTLEKKMLYRNYFNEPFCNESPLKQQISNLENHVSEMNGNISDTNYEQSLSKCLLYDTASWINNNTSSPSLITNGNALLEKDHFLKMDNSEEESMNVEDNIRSDLTLLKHNLKREYRETNNSKNLMNQEKNHLRI